MTRHDIEELEAAAIYGTAYALHMDKSVPVRGEAHCGGVAPEARGVEMIDDPDLTVGQVATKLQLSERTIRRYLAAGEFPDAYRLGERLGGGWRIPRADVDAFRRARSCR